MLRAFTSHMGRMAQLNQSFTPNLQHWNVHTFHPLWPCCPITRAGRAGVKNKEEKCETTCSAKRSKNRTQWESYLEDICTNKEVTFNERFLTSTELIMLIFGVKVGIMKSTKAAQTQAKCYKCSSTYSVCTLAKGNTCSTRNLLKMYACMWQLWEHPF